MRDTIKKIVRKYGLFDNIRIAEIYLNALLRRVHDADFYNIPTQINGGAIADIGANLGQSAISFRKLFPQSRIYSFEPNPICNKTLVSVQKLLNGNIEIHKCGVGNVNSFLDFYVPVLDDGTVLLQEGSFSEDTFLEEITKQRIGSNFDLKKMEIQVVTLDSLNLNFSLIKIDVQGLELQVLEGAAETIMKNRPVIFLERDTKTEMQIDEFLAERNYKAIKFGCNSLYIQNDL